MQTTIYFFIQMSSVDNVTFIVSFTQRHQLTALFHLIASCTVSAAGGGGGDTQAIHSVSWRMDASHFRHSWRVVAAIVDENTNHRVECVTVPVSVMSDMMQVNEKNINLQYTLFMNTINTFQVLKGIEISQRPS